ncbi:hypothetical protein GA0061096_2151 [Fictibacillus enclensis]|uniref:XRE family transcriptional regulator n=1 Tax=Fictibacillus enclensis TaxID=1017270 RepID=A0A0V8JFI0_9BACL|nr:hypothetical protein AS030_10260 [Fictibacillus enclensis]SCC03766.1 hypothetical protein GA0061096_2151 [Fictibacillus enclensis]
MEQNSKSRLGNWLTHQQLDNAWLEHSCGISPTLSYKLINDFSYKPNTNVMRKVLREVKGVESNAKIKDFWDA